MAEDYANNSNFSNDFDLAFALLEIPYGTVKEATIAFNSLRIDQEPTRGGVTKKLEVKDHNLIIKITSKDIKKLRTAVNSIMDFLILTTETIARFGST
ncbi:uncharacterized protein LOC129226108 [Uloborus diversus]|uniref:uncharacterized protein LOC129226108 n=1 Tax=Uloborus diversus TaxID=327109 RepID=UPI00240A3C46|nr:uncharacterized protein LOC129226108 [Uloborus diversus]